MSDSNTNFDDSDGDNDSAYAYPTRPSAWDNDSDFGVGYDPNVAQGRQIHHSPDFQMTGMMFNGATANIHGDSGDVDFVSSYTGPK